MQYKINNILYDIRDLIQAYIDDIIYDRSFLTNLFCILQVLFKIFLHCNIFIKLIKSYFNYPNISFLNQ